MKTFKIILVIIIIALLSFGGYSGYQYYQKWQDNQKSNELKIMEVLKANQGVIITLTTELAEIKKRVVGDTLKETVVVKEEAPTYESKKEELIELRKDPVVNEEEIRVARIVFEDRIDEFQASPDKILINLGEGKEKIVIYEDKQGNLVSLESGITITRHRKVEEVIKDLQVGKTVEVVKKKDLNLKAGGYYSFDGTYGVIISKGIINIKEYSLNVSLLINDFEDFRLVVGGDVGYMVRDNIELAFGYNTDKEFYGALRWSF